MPWEVEVTDEFVHWWDSLAADEQESVAAYVELLERRGPQLPHPYSSSVQTSRHGHMRELRAARRQTVPRPVRVRSTARRPAPVRG